MANEGTAYAVYLPEGGRVTLDVSAAGGRVEARWFDPRKRGFRQAARVTEAAAREARCAGRGARMGGARGAGGQGEESVSGARAIEAAGAGAADGILIETPENVDFTFAPAGVGVRALAYIIDLVVRYTPVLVVVMVFSLVGDVTQLERLGAWGTAAAFMLLFFVQWAYFVLFEYFWNGRTPGKRAMGIRVVLDGGYPITFVASAVRNLMRVVDSMPLFYGVGIISAFVSRREKRLGDFAGGTLVVREEPFDIEYLSVIEEHSRPSDSGETTRHVPLSAQEIDLITRFLERRRTLDDATSRAIAEAHRRQHRAARPRRLRRARQRVVGRRVSRSTSRRPWPWPAGTQARAGTSGSTASSSSARPPG